MKPLWFDENDGKITFLEQTRLPQDESWLVVGDSSILVRHIKSLDVRGAPLLGLAGAWGMVLIRLKYGWTQEADWFIEELRNARPTAVDLSKGVDAVRSAKTIDQAVALARAYELDNETSHTAMATASRALIVTSGLTRPLFICNAGQLATGATYGSSTGGWQMLAGENYIFTPTIVETRPLLQGSRLTAWEFEQIGVRHFVTLDSNAANLMRNSQIDSVWMGADRISKDRHIINKVGSYNLALVAHHFGIPVYVVAPKSTWDVSLNHRLLGGLTHLIEQRDPSEIVPWKHQIRPKYQRVLNPAFDIVPPEFISQIITS